MSAAARTAYDARLSLGEYRGMGRYLRALIAGREQELLGLCATGEYDPTLRLVADGFSVYPLWEQVSIPRLLRRYRPDVFLAPYNTAPVAIPSGTALVVVVHDLIFMERLPASRSAYQNAGRLYRRLIVPHAVRRADLILTVSNFTAQELASRFAIAPQRIRVIPVSLAEDWYDHPPMEREDYIFAVAGEAPSKNLSRALRAFALLRQHLEHRELRLKVAGVKAAFQQGFQDEARLLGIDTAVEFLPYIGEDEMKDLYQRAAVFFMPSLAEGFGIPVLEAMASGVPVVCSNRSSLPEVGGDAALYVNPTSVEHMAEFLHQTLRDSALRERMAERGLVQARRFHPEAVRSKIQAFWGELAQAAEPARRVEFVPC